MKLENIDLKKKENQTFKNWLRVMLENNYLIPFTMALAGIIYLLFSQIDSSLKIGFISFLTVICSIIGYKGLYQHWKDLCQGKSR